MDELKRCPFCGGEAELVKEVSCEGHGHHIEKVYVRCTHCGARGPLYNEIFKNKYDMPRDAILSWNKLRLI